MFDEFHLRDGIGNLDEFDRATSPGDDNVNVRRTRAQYLEHRFEGDPTVEERISQLIEHDEKVLASRDRLSRPHPARPSQRG
jgi:hypothetical protein